MVDVNALLPVDEAVAIVVARAQALLDRRAAQAAQGGQGDHDIREVSLWDASGYVLAEDILCDRDLPPFDKAMMDGYAVRAADVQGERSTLEVAGEVAAGATFAGEVGPGQAVRIMTGAPVPAGADAVMMVERTTPGAGDPASAGESRPGGGHVYATKSVVMRGSLVVGQNVGERGENAAKGSVIVERGRVIESLTAGVLGAVGAARPKVYRRPRVTVLTTGDELVPLEATPGPSQIRDSNRRTMMSMLEREFCRVVDGGIVPDNPAATREAIRVGLQSDVLVLSGGVSAGVYDLVTQALAEEGVTQVFHKVRIKPGKPLYFGEHAGGLVFGLPGNPVSAFVTALMFMCPALRVLGRRPEHRSWTLDLPLMGTVPASKGRTTFHPGCVVRDADGVMHVRMQKWRGSADQISYSRGDVLIRREVGTPEATPGTIVRVVLPHTLASW